MQLEVRGQQRAVDISALYVTSCGTCSASIFKLGAIKLVGKRCTKRCKRRWRPEHEPEARRCEPPAHNALH